MNGQGGAAGLQALSAAAAFVPVYPAKGRFPFQPLNEQTGPAGDDGGRHRRSRCLIHCFLHSIQILADYSFGERAWDYLERMVQLCQAHDIQLILIKAPSLYPYWYPEWEAQIEDFARERDLPYLNFLELTEETGIDYSTDTYDAGLHMNLSGAEKLSDYMGKLLREEYGVPDRRGDPQLDRIWADNLAAYEAEQQAQYECYGMTPRQEGG